MIDIDKFRGIFFVFAALLALFPSSGYEARAACTVILIGKDATADGSVVLAANDDWPGYPSHLVHVPGKKHATGEMYTLVRGKRIPQVETTFGYNYVCCVYSTGTRKESWLYGINENQVAVAMAGAYNFKEFDTEGCELEADDLPWLVLERAKTARDGLEIITGLIDELGLDGGSVDEGGSVSLAIADPDEGWWFEPIPGGPWMATRVPDNAVSFRPNCFGTHVVDLNDKANLLISDNLVNLAVANGWYKPGTPFDYVGTYCLSRDRSEGFHETDPVNAMRRWRMASLFSGKKLPEKRVAYEVVPENKITIRGVMAVLRDYLQGTEYDLSKAPGSGAYGNPFHEDWGIGLSRAGTVVSIVTQLRSRLPNEIGGIMWVAFDTPATSVYVPWYLGITDTPEPYKVGEAGKYNDGSAWWNFQEVGNLCFRRYHDAALKDVIPAWKTFEDREFEEIGSIDKKALQLYREKGRAAAREFLNEYSNLQGIRAMETAAALKNRLRGKYLDNTVVEANPD